MRNNLVRVIGVLLWKHGQIVQTEKFHVTNVIHDNPIHAIEAFDASDLDELALINISKDSSLNQNFSEEVYKLTRKLRIPLVAGGGIRNLDDCNRLLRAGADKLILNSLIFEDLSTTENLLKSLGASTFVASLDFMYLKNNSELRYLYNHQNQTKTKFSLNEVLQKIQKVGFGEIFFNNVLHDGSRIGYDTCGLKQIANLCNIPIVAFGGVANWNHLIEGIEAGADAVAFGNALHYVEMAPKLAKLHLLNNGYKIRT